MMYNAFYRTFGVRYPDKLANPTPLPFDALPRNAVFHHVGGEHGPADVEIGDKIFQGYSKKIALTLVTDYVQTDGVVRRPMFNLADMVRPWARTARKNWDIVKEAELLKISNQDTLLVYNYGYLDKVHVYTPVLLNKYYRWLNRQRTVWAKVAEAAKTGDRQHFLIYPVPSMIQGMTILDKYAAEAVSPRTESIFGLSGDAGFMQLDLWRWMSIQHRSKSSINAVSPEHYCRVNLVFVGKNGQAVILNLGYLNSWFKGQPNTTEFGGITQYAPQQLQKLYLRLCMVLNGVLDETVSEDETEGTGEPQNPKPATSEIQDLEPEEDEHSEVPSLVVKTDPVPLDAGSHGPVGFTEKTKGPSASNGVDHSFVSSVSDSLFSELERDTAALDRLSLTQLQNAGIKLSVAHEPEVEDERPVVDIEAVKKMAYGEKTAAEKLQDRLKKDAEANLLTAADYRKLKAAADAYQNSSSPYDGKTPRGIAQKVEEVDIALTAEGASIEVSDSVVDRNMASSTLLNFNKQYIRKVLDKDVLRMVDAVQAAGIVIRRHDIETVTTVLGTYEHHVLELKPVDGAPSTIRFSFPKVNERGIMKAGSSNYLMRKQRVD